MAQLPPKPWSEDSSSLSKTSLVGVVVGVLVLVPIMAGVGVYFAKKWRKAKDAEVIAMRVFRGQGAAGSEGGVTV